MTNVSVVVEGLTDEPIAIQLLSAKGYEAVNPPIICRGKGMLDSNLSRYNHAARFSPWLVLRDMDHDAPCAAALRERLLPSPTSKMRFRIAVRSAESWLMADHARFAAFLGVPANRIPPNPDLIEFPKQAVVNLARNSTKRKIREGMVPEQGTVGVAGIAFVTYLQEFALFHWRPEVAASRSESLRRALAAINWA